jgi:hypothetical protein
MKDAHKPLTWKDVNKYHELVWVIWALLITLAGYAMLDHYLEQRSFNGARTISYMMMGGTEICMLMVVINVYKNNEPSFLKYIAIMMGVAGFVLILLIILDSLFLTSFIGWNQRLFNMP